MYFIMQNSRSLKEAFDFDPRDNILVTQRKRLEIQRYPITKRRTLMS